MYALQSKTKTLMKRWTKSHHITNPFEFDEVNNPVKKVKLFTKPKHPENLWIDVHSDLKIKTDLFTWMKEEGLSITPIIPEEPQELTPLQRMLESLDLNWQSYIFGRLDELEPYCLDKDLIFWFYEIRAFNDCFEDFTEHPGNDWNLFNYYNNEIHEALYDFSWNIDMGKYVGSNQIEIYKLIDDFLSSFVLMMDRITVVKNFLIVCDKNKKSYIITNSNERVTEINQGENLNNMKSVNGKNKMERMINKPFKYMGLVVTDDSSNKHLYAEVQQGDFNKYAYFVVYENPIRFNQTLANGRTISKYCFHIDNFDDGKGHDAIFVPSWMALELVNGDVSEKVGYLVAFEKNQWNNPIIAKLDKLDAGCDSIKVLTADNIQGLKYHY